jgi:inorganic triphosphatase YgiF
VTSSKGDHLETEQKYDADADFVLPKLGSLPDLGGKRLANPKRIYLSATYYDTEDLALIQHKVTLRRRVGGDDEGWHLKLPVRKDTRQELHAPLGEGTGGSVPARLADQVKDITAGQPLHPVAILDTERTVVTLPGPSGAPLVEVADDLVTAIRFGEPDSGPMTWREIEVEVLSPDSGAAAAMLESVGTVLREAGARPSASGSKLARVMDAG